MKNKFIEKKKVYSKINQKKIWNNVYEGAISNNSKHSEKKFDNRFKKFIKPNYGKNKSFYNPPTNQLKKVFTLDSTAGQQYRFTAIDGYHLMRRARQYYLNAQRTKRDWRPGINAAFKQFDKEKFRSFSFSKGGYVDRRNNYRPHQKWHHTKLYNKQFKFSPFSSALATGSMKSLSKFSFKRSWALKTFKPFYKNKQQRYSRFSFRRRTFKQRRWRQSEFSNNFRFQGKGQLKRGSRFKTWKTCKKPFWKRKSFKFIKLYNLIFLNTFKTYTRRRLKMKKMRRRKVVGFDRQGRKRRKRFFGKRFWYEYFRRNKIKFWFRNKIALRFAWMTRYSCWSHTKAAKFVWRIRRRTPALLRFWYTYEFTLDKYVIWWQIAPKLTQNNVEYSRRLIKNGYVYVNFVVELSPRYRIKLGDCVFILKQTVGKLHKFYITARLMNPFKSQFRRGYRFRCIARFQPKYLFKKKFMFFLKRFKMIKRLSHWSKAYSLYYQYFMERSYKYRIFVNLHSMSWFTLIFSTIGKMYYPITYYLINSFVNRRYG